MQFATLLFYGISSFFLGLLANAAGGASVLQSVFDPNGFVAGSSHEPWQTILEALALVVPLVFVVLALMSIVRPPGDAPASATEIRDLMYTSERAGSTDRPPNARPDRHRP